jgi:hypothetical protein
VQLRCSTDQMGSSQSHQILRLPEMAHRISFAFFISMCSLPPLSVVSFLKLLQLWWSSSAKSSLSIASISVLNVQALAETRCFITFQVNFATILALPLLFAATMLLIYGIYLAAQKCSWGIIERLYAKLSIRETYHCSTLLSQSTLSFLSFAYMFLAQESFTIFDCVEVVGLEGSRVREFVSLECYSQEWRPYLPGAILGILFYACGIPALFLWLAKHGKWKMLLTSQLSSLKLNREWWLAFQLMWKLTFVLVLRFLLSSTTAQLTLIASLIAVRLFGVQIWRPYRSELHNREEIAMSCLALLILVCGGVFYVRHGSLSQGVEDALLAIVICTLLIMATIVPACTWIAWKEATARKEQDADREKEEMEMDIRKNPMEQSDGDKWASVVNLSPR